MKLKILGRGKPWIIQERKMSSDLFKRQRKRKCATETEIQVEQAMGQGRQHPLEAGNIYKKIITPLQTIASRSMR